MFAMVQEVSEVPSSGYWLLVLQGRNVGILPMESMFVYCTRHFSVKHLNLIVEFSEYFYRE